MNIILFSHAEMQQQTITVEGQRARHIIKILKAKPGDIFTTGEINSTKGTSRIHTVARNSVTFDQINHTTPSPRAEVDLIMALPRPIMLKRVLAQVAMLGVNHLDLINSNRVEKSFFSSSVLEPEKIHQRLLAGLEQACVTDLPTVRIHKRFRPFVEDELTPRLPAYAHCGLAHPQTDATINELFQGGHSGKTLLIIGPEGGWVPYEVEKLNDLGVQSFNMGERILRVDSVVPTLLGQLSLLRSLT